MKMRKLCFLGALFAVAVAVPLLVQHRASVCLSAQQELLRQQTRRAGELAAENDRLSAMVANARSAPSLAETQLTELLRLRNEIGQLRRALGETNQLERKIHRMRDGLQDLANEEKTGEKATALLADETELRRERVARLKQWLEENPEEKIPELQFLSEDGWVRSADRPRVTDEEFRGWMSAQRGNAEGKFAHIAFLALKQYARANNGGFPTDLSQLKPYFESPVDYAILQRYEIVPAKSLIKFLAEAGGDWVITQKAPVNKAFDARVAISATDCRGTVEQGRWDPVP